MARRKTSGGREPDATLQLLMDAAVAANEARSLDEAVQTTIDLVCAFTGWPVGHCYWVDPRTKTLSPSALWHLDDDGRYGPFVEVTSRTTLEFGEGLPGRTLGDAKPAWVIDVTKDDNFPRARDARDIGVRAGFAFPVLSGSEVGAVLEFFSPIAAAPDEGLLDVMAHVGTQLGRVIERSRADQALRMSEDAYRRIIETANDPFVGIDIDGNIVDWNQHAELTFGWGRDDVLGRPLTDTIIPERYRSAHLRGLSHFLETGEGPVLGKPVELAALHREGHEFPIELTVWALNVGTTWRFNAFIHDITERKRADDSLKESEQKFAEAYRRERDAGERLRAADDMKNSFMTALSHELRTPLTSVLGFAKMLDERAGVLSAEQQRDFISRIAENAEKLDRLLEDLLDLDRLVRGIVEPRRAPTDLRAMFETITRTFRAWDAGHIEIQGERIVADIDAAKVERIVENLIANATKYAPDAKIWVRAERESEGVLIVVEDSGPGIPDDVKQAVFEPFMRAKPGVPHAPGTGIGLALVARFAELHGGRAWVEDRPGGGACFKVWLRARVE